MNAPVSDLVIFAGVFVKTWRVPVAGTLIEQHTHKWPHVTLVMQGRMRVFQAGAELGVFEAPALIRIAANVAHHFITLSDDVTLACVHAVANAGED